MSEVDNVNRTNEQSDFSARKDVRLGYLINQYPKVSHTFIRREILELEEQGFQVRRYAMRGYDDVIVDELDSSERDRTAYLLKDGSARLFLDMIRVSIKRPTYFLKALLAAFRMGVGGDRLLPYHFFYLAEACRLYLWAVRDGVTHLHAHFGTNSTEVAMLVGTIGNIPYSFTVHGPEEFDKAGPLHLSQKIRSAALVVAVSSFCRSQLYRTVDYAYWPKIRVVRCALESAFYSVSNTIISTEPRLVCVGRLCEQKGQLLSVEAVSRLINDGYELKLVLAGDGEMRPEIEALIRERGLESIITITGWVSSSRVKNEVLSARALVLPSFAEGLPVALMEAMALGKPVLTTWVAGIPELVTHGESGWLFPPGDVDSIVGAITELLHSTTGRLREMGEQARAHALARHDIRIEVKKFADHIVAIHNPGAI